MLQASGISSQQDVYAVEAMGFPQDLPGNTYDMIRQGVAINPQALALSFFLQVKDHRHPETWTYAQLLDRITQTANFFDSLGAFNKKPEAFCPSGVSKLTLSPAPAYT